jgi:uncharacterized protein DUF6600
MTGRTLVTAALAALLLLGTRPIAAHAQSDDRPDASEIETSLAADGYWLDDPQVGRAWRPNVEWDWRPYTFGRWVWTDYGWTWASDESWAWTFHYGRWVWLGTYGWVWLPGLEWGPGWVDWWWSDGFVGWGPVGPSGLPPKPEQWVFTHEVDFCAPHVATAIVDQRHVPDYIVNHGESGWGRHHPPDVRDIERVSRVPVERLPGRPKGSIAPWVTARLDRGERVRERVDDHGVARTVDHPAGRPRPAGEGGWQRGGRDDDERMVDEHEPVRRQRPWTPGPMVPPYLVPSTVRNKPRNAPHPAPQPEHGTAPERETREPVRP